MPFTPFHMGPGLALKSIGGRRFSIALFGLAQVVIDIEPLVGLLCGATVLHGFTHTCLGALLIALPCVLPGKWICEWLLDWWNRWSTRGNEPDWRVDPTISWRNALLSAYLGTFSHVSLAVCRTGAWGNVIRSRADGRRNGACWHHDEMSTRVKRPKSS